MAESKKEMDDLCVMLSECNLMRNPREWWMDFGATHHVCANKELFAAFALAQVKEKIYMANSATAKVEGTRKVCLKMTLGKVLTLNNILFTTKLIGESILTANRILKRVPHSKTQSIPYEKWKGKKPNLKYFKVWRCLTKVQVPIPKRIKIGLKTVDCVFIGYAKSSKAYDMLILSRDISDINATKRILESKFDMKDLGVADVILVIRIHRTPQGLALSQSHYIEKVEEQYFGNHPNRHVLLALRWTKFIALDKADEEAEWLQNFLEDFPYWPKPWHRCILKLHGSKISNLPIDRVHPMHVHYEKFKGKSTYLDAISLCLMITYLSVNFYKE
ncbi:hypothetical protein FXO38_12517 [Capsicum annuum]|nr:hypothetical protein FXO38_12517 [Capsicum annuum]